MVKGQNLGEFNTHGVSNLVIHPFERKRQGLGPKTSKGLEFSWKQPALKLQEQVSFVPLVFPSQT